MAREEVGGAAARDIMVIGNPMAAGKRVREKRREVKFRWNYGLKLLDDYPSFPAF